MQTIPYWIQRADFTATQYEPIDAGRAVQVFAAHDWAAELRLMRERLAAGEETCDPGVGFIAGPGRILHICPAADRPALVHYHFTEPQRWLGFILIRATVVRTNSAVEPSDLPDFIRRFYGEDHAWLVSRTNAT